MCAQFQNEYLIISLVDRYNDARRNFFSQ